MSSDHRRVTGDSEVGCRPATPDAKRRSEFFNSIRLLRASARPRISFTRMAQEKWVSWPNSPGFDEASGQVFKVKEDSDREKEHRFEQNSPWMDSHRPWIGGLDLGIFRF